LKVISIVNLHNVASNIVKSLDADVAIQGDSSLVVHGRPLAIQRAITNLVRNAVLYGASPVTITIERQSCSVAFIVCDAGQGVDPAMLKTLSRPFVRGNSSRSGIAGTGLGLTIARHVADQHEGSLTFANLPGGGFQAVLRFPS
jgi:two-component system, OmpR family, osmolarity sensor histidine kinase EnvZ